MFCCVGPAVNLHYRPSAGRFGTSITIPDARPIRGLTAKDRLPINVRPEMSAPPPSAEAMHKTAQMEKFSEAYVLAVASAAGLRMSIPNVDDDGIDLTLYARGGDGPYEAARLDIQLKCTGRGQCNAPTLYFRLPVKNYVKLRSTKYCVPRILVVVVIPADIESWLDHNGSYLALYRCAYWISLRGAPETTRQSKEPVSIPVTQTFSVAALRQIMHDISNGNPP